MKRLLLLCCLLGALPCFALASAQGNHPSPLQHSTQVIVVTTPGWNTVDGRLQRYQRRSTASAWSAVGAPISIVVGKSGMGWGIGIVSIPAARNARNAGEPVKKEGDLRSPAGIFSLGGTAFGYAPHDPAEWKVPYLALTPATECVDDSHSRFYNRIVDRSTVSPDWHSSEHMRSAGEAYRWGIVIDQNTNSPRPQGGSCVFLHIWAGLGHGTTGCTAMPESQVKSILGWLDPSAHPLLVQMPIAQYRQSEKSLHLPLPPAAPHS